MIRCNHRIASCEYIDYIFRREKKGRQTWLLPCISPMLTSVLEILELTWSGIDPCVRDSFQPRIVGRSLELWLRSDSSYHYLIITLNSLIAFIKLHVQSIWSLDQSYAQPLSYREVRSWEATQRLVNNSLCKVSCQMMVLWSDSQSGC